ncbi:MAG TPA: 4'-phosphopantetheinyl transferase superfamily protein [Nitriliruptorales bacterium]
MVELDAAVRIGCDVVGVARLGAKLQRTPGLRRRLFTDRELVDAERGGVDPSSSVALERLAARFAAKEATRKALGDLRLGFHDTEIRTGPDGAPHLYVHGRPSGLSVSLSHDAGVAMAVVAGAANTVNRTVADRGDHRVAR